MYTVILLKKEKNTLFEQYQFVFLRSILKGELDICVWENMNMTIRKINALIKNHVEWKLVFYNGDDKWDRMNGDAWCFLKFVAGNGLHSEHDIKLEGAFPAQILYICEKEKSYIPLRADSDFCYVDGDREMGDCFRMFQFEMKSGNGKLQSSSEFKLCCVLLTFALGEIPYVYVEAGYLYQVDLEINWELFVQYIMMLDGRFAMLEKMQEKEWENLRIRLNTAVNFPDYVIPEIKIEKNYWKTEDIEKNKCILSFFETLKNENIENILKQNRALLQLQMLYPKGVLREECGKIYGMIDNIKGIGNFLDEAGKELLERKIHEILNEMSERRDTQFEQQEFEQSISEKEDLIREQATRIIKKKIRWIVLFTGCLLELFVTEPFACNLAIKMRWDLMGICTLCGFGTIAIIHIGYYGYLFWCHQKSWKSYDADIFKYLKKYQEDKRAYLEKMLSLIVDFRYLEKLRREQEMLLYKWESDRKMLEKHCHVLENGKIKLNTLKRLLAEEEQKKYLYKKNINIDFSITPKEEDYYHMPLQEENCQAEINYTGYKVNAVFDFITRIMIKKVICSGELN